MNKWLDLLVDEPRFWGPANHNRCMRVRISEPNTWPMWMVLAVLLGLILIAGVVS